MSSGKGRDVRVRGGRLGRGRGDGERARRAEDVGEGARRAEDVGRGEDRGVEGEEMDRLESNGIVERESRKYKKRWTERKRRARCKGREER